MCYARVTDARQHYLDDARRIIAEADEADVVYREGRYAKAKLRRLVDVMVARLCAGAALNDSEDRKGRSSAAHARACRYAFVSVI